MRDFDNVRRNLLILVKQQFVHVDMECEEQRAAHLNRKPNLDKTAVRMGFQILVFVFVVSKGKADHDSVTICRIGEKYTSPVATGNV